VTYHSAVVDKELDISVNNYLKNNALILR